MEAELFATGFEFGDDVSVDGFLLEVFGFLRVCVSCLVGLAFAFSVEQGPGTDEVLSLAENLVVGSGEVVVVVLVEGSAQSSDLVSVLVRGVDFSAVTVADQFELAVADLDADFSVGQLLGSDQRRVLSVFSLVFHGLARLQKMLLSVDKESRRLVAIRLDADDLIFTVILSDDQNKLLLLVAGFADQDGQLLAVVLVNVFL